MQNEIVKHIEIVLVFLNSLVFLFYILILYSNPKEEQCQRMFKLPYSCTHFTCQQGNAQNLSSLASTACEERNSTCTSWLLKGRGTKDQTANICWTIGKAREFQKNIYFCFSNYAKAFDCVYHNKLWRILQEMGIPDHLTCFLRSNSQNWTWNNGLVQR